MIRRLIVACVALLLVLMDRAYAHTALKSSSPATESILEALPDELVLTFTEATRLTSIVVVSPAGNAQLQFSPAGAAESFKSAKPPLIPGRNEVRWYALSRDGHVVEGKIFVVIRSRDP